MYPPTRSLLRQCVLAWRRLFLFWAFKVYLITITIMSLRLWGLNKTLSTLEISRGDRCEHIFTAKKVSPLFGARWTPRAQRVSAGDTGRAV